MKAAKLYINHATDRVGYALSQMPATTGTSKPLPSSHLEIIRYIEHLLTPSEQAACDMATD